jgi:pimeloyl-ACP methyl ester carboxylesterase
MGGYVSLAFAARHPARLERLILADTRAAADSDAARAGGRMRWLWWRSKAWPHWSSASSRRCSRPPPARPCASRCAGLGKQSPEGVSAGIRALRDRPDRRAELATIRCPTLVIVGTEDKISPPTEMADIARPFLARVWWKSRAPGT